VPSARPRQQIRHGRAKPSPDASRPRALVIQSRGEVIGLGALRLGTLGACRSEVDRVAELDALRVLRR